MDGILIFALLMIFAYVILYLRGRVYLREDYYDDDSDVDVIGSGSG